jgi:hypothetical protein
MFQVFLLLITYLFHKRLVAKKTDTNSNLTLLKSNARVTEIFIKNAQHFNPLQTEFLLTIYKYSVHTSQETHYISAKVQPVNAVWGNSRCLL